MTRAQSNLILALLGTDDNGFLSIEVQKLMFACAKMGDESVPYDFVPYEQGCYSLTLAHDVHALADRCLVRRSFEKTSGKSRWSLTETGRESLMQCRDTSERMVRFRRRYPVRGIELVRDIYRRYPYWAINSTIKDIVLAGDAESQERIKAARPEKTEPLASIGYEGRSLEDYLNALIRNGIQVLCDVRKNPISRKYGFSKSTLQFACEGVGVEYRHFPELGIPSYERTDLRFQVDYDNLFARYERDVLPRVGDSLDVLCRLVEEGQNIALTCFEANPAQCHRTRVLRAITNRIGVVPVLI